VTASRGLASSPLWGGRMSPIRTGRGEGQLTLDASLAGMCARRRTYFLLRRQKKVGKEKATPLAVSPSLRCGATCDARGRGAAAELAACCALRSDNRSESVYEARACCAARAHPVRCASRHVQRGREIHTGRRCARPSHPHPSPLPQAGEGVWGRAQRWPVGVPTPLCACRGAQGVGRAWAAQHAHASCSDSLRLFERSAQRVVSSAVPPHDRAPQVAP